MISHQIIRGKPVDVVTYLEQNVEGVLEYYREHNSKIYSYIPEGFQTLFDMMGYDDDLKRIAFLSGRKRVGVDLTFSVAKDVSVMALLVDRDIVSDVRDVVIEMVSKVDDMIYTRRKKGGERVYEKASAMINVYEHYTSRTHDPNLHYHIFVSNQVLCQDGEITALANEYIVKNKWYLNVLASYELVRKLQERGYNAWLDKYGNTRIIDDDNLISLFSKRTEEIKKKALELYGTSDFTKLTRDQYRELVIMTRGTKKYEDAKTLEGIWKLELEENGYTVEGLRERARREWSGELTQEEWQRAMEQAIERLSEYEGIFKKEGLIFEFLRQMSELSKETGKMLPKLEQALSYAERFIEERLRVIEGNLVAGRETGIKVSYCATQEYLAVERSAFLTGTYLLSQKKILFNEDEINREIQAFEREKGFTLSQDQKATIYELAQGQAMSIICGHAGAGKTTAAEVFRRLADMKGLKVIGLAPTGKAAEELAKTLGVGRTIDSFLHEVEKGKISIDRNTILFVDEAGMVDARRMKKLLDLARSTGCKMVLQGDWKQIKPVQAGDLFSDLYHSAKERGVGVVDLTEIRRQKKQEYLDLTKALSARDFEVAYRMLTGKPDWIRNWDPNQLVSDFTENYRRTLVVASTNALKDELNMSIKNKLVEKGEVSRGVDVKVRDRREIWHLEDVCKGDTFRVGKEKYTVSDVDLARGKVYAISVNGERKEFDFSMIRGKQFEREKTIQIGTGERIICTKNDRRIGVKNGEMFVVISVDNDKITIQNENKRITLNIKDYNYLDYGYAVTVHKSQGMTVSQVFVADSNGKINFNQFYVGVTRGKENFRLYTNDAVTSLFNAQFTQKKLTQFSLQRKNEESGKFITKDQIAKLLIRDEETYKKYAKYIDDLKERREIRERITGEKTLTFAKDQKDLKKPEKEVQKPQEKAPQKETLDKEPQRTEPQRVGVDDRKERKADRMKEDDRMKKEADRKVEKKEEKKEKRKETALER